MIESDAPVPPRALTLGKSVNRSKHDVELAEVLDGMADRLLGRADVAARGLLEPEYVGALRRRPPGKAYGRERSYRLWSLLLLELWSRIYLDGRGALPDASTAAPAPSGAATAPTVAAMSVARTGTHHG